MKTYEAPKLGRQRVRGGPGRKKTRGRAKRRSRRTRTRLRETVGGIARAWPAGEQKIGRPVRIRRSIWFSSRACIQCTNGLHIIMIVCKLHCRVVFTDTLPFLGRLFRFSRFLLSQHLQFGIHTEQITLWNILYSTILIEYYHALIPKQKNRIF